MSRQFLTTREAAWALGYSTVTLQRWAKQGLITPVARSPVRGDMRWDLDDLRRQLGARTVPAPETPQTDPGKPQQPAVIAAVITSRLGVLAVQRRDGKPPWSFPAGESEPGESPIDTIVRETKEETGLLIKPGAVIAERIHPKTGRHMVYVAATPATRNRDVFVGDDLELTAVQWLTRAEAEELMPSMAPQVHQYLAQRMTGPVARGTRKAS